MLGFRIPVAIDRLQLRFAKLDPLAQMPSTAHGPEEDAGMDLHSVEAAEILPGSWSGVGTGIAVEIPPGYEGQVRPRSGMARKHGVTVLNSPGTVDPGYRGEIRVTLINHGSETFSIQPGDRIAQLIIGRYAAVDWELAENLDETERGEGGFGSTGR